MLIFIFSEANYMENLKEKIELAVDKAKNDPNFAASFQENPVKCMEEIMGMDLPDDEINKIINTVKAKITLDESGILGKIKGLFD